MDLHEALNLFHRFVDSELFKALQLSGTYEDSKRLVDMAMKMIDGYSHFDRQRFETLLNEFVGVQLDNPEDIAIWRRFIEDNFHSPRDEMMERPEGKEAFSRDHDCRLFKELKGAELLELARVSTAPGGT